MQDNILLLSNKLDMKRYPGFLCVTMERYPDVTMTIHQHILLILNFSLHLIFGMSPLNVKLLRENHSQKTNQ
jgi:hypothetical protein